MDGSIRSGLSTHPCEGIAGACSSLDTNKSGLGLCHLFSQHACRHP